MTADVIVPTRVAVSRGADARVPGRDRFRWALQRRAGRIRVLLLVLVLLLPLLITTVLGGR